MRSTAFSACVFGALLCSCLAFPAFGDNPCPEYCSVTGSVNPDGVLIGPGSMVGNSLTITVRNCSNVPLPYSSVTVHFNSEIRVCADAVHAGVTGPSGVCVIQLRAGGCVRNTSNACLVVANGIWIKSYLNVKSPDNAAHTQSLPDGTVGLADLAYFGDEFKGTAPPACHDYDNDGDCDVVDLTYFGDPFKVDLHCTLP